ncbi:unnamed protein product, partial [Cladocopium goreaui]
TVSVDPLLMSVAAEAVACLAEKKVTELRAALLLNQKHIRNCQQQSRREAASLLKGGLSCHSERKVLAVYALSNWDLSLALRAAQRLSRGEPHCGNWVKLLENFSPADNGPTLSKALGAGVEVQICCCKKADATGEQQTVSVDPLLMSVAAEAVACLAEKKVTELRAALLLNQRHIRNCQQQSRREAASLLKGGLSCHSERKVLAVYALSNWDLSLALRAAQRLSRGEPQQLEFLWQLGQAPREFFASRQWAHAFESVGCGRDVTKLHSALRNFMQNPVSLPLPAKPTPAEMALIWPKRAVLKQQLKESTKEIRKEAGYSIHASEKDAVELQQKSIAPRKLTLTSRSLILISSQHTIFSILPDVAAARLLAAVAAVAAVAPAAGYGGCSWMQRLWRLLLAVAVARGCGGCGGCGSLVDVGAYSDLELYTQRPLGLLVVVFACPARGSYPLLDLPQSQVVILDDWRPDHGALDVSSLWPTADTRGGQKKGLIRQHEPVLYLWPLLV